MLNSQPIKESIKRPKTEFEQLLAFEHMQISGLFLGKIQGVWKHLGTSFRSPVFAIKLQTIKVMINQPTLYKP